MVESRIYLSIAASFLVLILIGLIIYFIYLLRKPTRQYKTNQQRNEEFEKIITSIYLQNINTNLITKSDSEIKQDSQVFNLYKKECQGYDEITDLDYHTFPRAPSFKKFIKYDKKLHRRYHKRRNVIVTEKQRAIYDIYLDSIVGLGRYFIIIVLDCLINDIERFIPEKEKEELLVEVDLLIEEFNCIFVNVYLGREKNIEHDIMKNALLRFYNIIFPILHAFDKKDKTIASGCNVLILQASKILQICDESMSLFVHSNSDFSRVLFFFMYLKLNFKKDILVYLKVLDSIHAVSVT